MTSKKEQFYIQRISELEAQLKQRDEQIAALEKQVAELLKATEALVKKNAELAEKVAKLSKNSSNSSKPPSSDIVKPPKANQSDGLCPRLTMPPSKRFARLLLTGGLHRSVVL